MTEGSLFDDEEIETMEPAEPEQDTPECAIRSPWIRLNRTNVELINKIHPFMRQPADKSLLRDGEGDSLVLLALGRPCRSWGMDYVSNRGLSLHFHDYGNGKWTLTGGTIGNGSCAKQEEITEAATAILEELAAQPSLFELDEEEMAHKGLVFWSPRAKDNSRVWLKFNPSVPAPAGYQLDQTGQVK